MSDLGAMSAVIIDLVILVCLIVAIGLGSVLLWHIVKFKKEQFKFDNMTKAMSGQMAIFQSALESGKLDLEVKIERMNKAIRIAQDILDDMHELTKGAPINQGSNVTSITARKVATRQDPPLSKETVGDADDTPRHAPTPIFTIMDPEFENDLKEDASPAIDDYDDLSESDKRELAKLGTPAERALMAALKRAGRG